MRRAPGSITHLFAASGRAAKNGRAVPVIARRIRPQSPPLQWVRRAYSNKPGGIFSDLLEKEEKAHASLVRDIEDADKPTPPPPPSPPPGSTDEDHDAMSAKLRAAADASNARKAAAAAAEEPPEEGAAAGQEAQADDASPSSSSSSSSSSSPGGRGAEWSPEPTEAEMEKFDLLDEDLQDIIKGWEVWDGKPVRLGAVLAGNMIFEVKALRATTMDARAELEGLDSRDREAIDLWLHPEKAASSSDDDRAAATGSANGVADTLSDLSQKNVNWAAMATQARGFLHSAWGEVKESAVEIFKIDKDESVLKKKVHGAAPRPRPSDGDEDGDFDGPVSDPEVGSAVVLVRDGKTAWERLQERLRDAPMFQELYRRAREAQKSHIGQKAQEQADRVNDKIEDVREAWETSQNPWVYRLSELWDSVTHETDTAVVLRELRRLDPDFSLEEWRENMRDVLVPELIAGWLRGDKQVLKYHCKKDLVKRLMHDIGERKKERILIDPNVLSVDHAEVIVDPGLTEQNMLIGLFVAAQQSKLQK